MNPSRYSGGVMCGYCGYSVELCNRGRRHRSSRRQAAIQQAVCERFLERTQEAAIAFFVVIISIIYPELLRAIRAGR